MSLLALSTPALKTPFLLLTFACTSPTMQDCEVYTERFETQNECTLAATQAQELPIESLSAFLPDKYTDTLVSYCSFAPEEEGKEPEVFNFLIPKKPQPGDSKDEQ